MATIAAQEATVQGLDAITFTAADALGDDSSTGTTSRALVIRNNDVAPHTVTVDTPVTFRGLVVANPAVVVPAGEVGMVPLVRSVFGTFPAWTYDSATGVEVAVVELAR